VKTVKATLHPPVDDIGIKVLSIKIIYLIFQEYEIDIRRLSMEIKTKDVTFIL
jgi:hypothetical protein